MLTYKGKYNSANVMTDIVDEATVTQIYNFLNHPAFADTYIAIMSDVHCGMGCVIGYTAKMNNYVISSVIGVDIGCGVDAYSLGQRPADFEALDKFIRENIPSGSRVRGKTLDIGNALLYDIEKICKKIEADENYVRLGIGTLGGGNHFIELDKDDAGNLWLLLHSGSRRFGMEIATYHQRKAKALMKEMFIGAAYHDLEFLPMNNGGKEYLQDMTVAQEYAEANRHNMAKIILEGFFGVDVDQVPSIKSVHNYINFSDNIIRKGAISAHEGEKVIIPLNMRDGAIIGTGKGNAKWNFSAPHGAGRNYSRKRAKAELSLDQFQKEMVGVWSSCVSQHTLDESPMAYKNKDEILATLDETVTVDTIIKPVYNFKAVD